DRRRRDRQPGPGSSGAAGPAARGGPGRPLRERPDGVPLHVAGRPDRQGQPHVLRLDRPHPRPADRHAAARPAQRRRPGLLRDAPRSAAAHAGGGARDRPGRRPGGRVAPAVPAQRRGAAGRLRRTAAAAGHTVRGDRPAPLRAGPAGRAAGGEGVRGPVAHHADGGLGPGRRHHRRGRGVGDRRAQPAGDARRRGGAGRRRRGDDGGRGRGAAAAPVAHRRALRRPAAGAARGGRRAADPGTGAWRADDRAGRSARDRATGGGRCAGGGRPHRAGDRAGLRRQPAARRPRPRVRAQRRAQRPDQPRGADRPAHDRVGRHRPAVDTGPAGGAGAGARPAARGDRPAGRTGGLPAGRRPAACRRRGRARGGAPARRPRRAAPGRPGDHRPGHRAWDGAAGGTAPRSAAPAPGRRRAGAPPHLSAGLPPQRAGAAGRAHAMGTPSRTRLPRLDGSGRAARRGGRRARPRQPRRGAAGRRRAPAGGGHPLRGPGARGVHRGRRRGGRAAGAAGCPRRGQGPALRARRAHLPRAAGQPAAAGAAGHRGAGDGGALPGRDAGGGGRRRLLRRRPAPRRAGGAGGGRRRRARHHGGGHHGAAQLRLPGAAGRPAGAERHDRPVAGQLAAARPATHGDGAVRDAGPCDRSAADRLGRAPAADADQRRARGVPAGRAEPHARGAGGTCPGGRVVRRAPGRRDPGAVHRRARREQVGRHRRGHGAPARRGRAGGDVGTRRAVRPAAGRPDRCAPCRRHRSAGTDAPGL
ncbi:MAG: Uncharacterized, RsbU-domain-containing protein, partial [uncultured Blastococcus sp.]